MVRVSMGLDTFEDWQGVSSDVNNLCAHGRHWYEKVASNGRYRRDRLTFADPATGMPTQLPPNTIAETVIACIEPGEYICEWEGGATVQVVLLGPSALSDGELNPPIEDLEEHSSVDATNVHLAPPVGPIGVLAADVRFTHPGGGIKQALIRISDVSIADPIRNLRVVLLARRAQWQEFSPAFHQRASELRPPWVRLLNMFEPNADSYRRCVETPADIRPDTWWTQSNTWVDSFTVGVGAWSGATPTFGSHCETERWNGTVWQSIGSCDVMRVGSPVAGADFHVKQFGTRGLIGDRLRDVDTGSIATIDQDMSRWMDINQGPSIKMVLDLCAEMRQYGTVGAILNMHGESDLATHTVWADRCRGDARLAGFLWSAEWSNETWNQSLGLGRSYLLAIDRGVALGMPMHALKPWEAGGQYYGYIQDITHDHWVARFTLSGQQSQYRRFFFVQSASGTYWYDYRTIINPESLAGFPAWPRRVMAIDAIFGAGYAGHTDEAPYNTTAWQRGASPQDWRNYIVGNQFPIHITGPGSHLRTLKTWATTRGCEASLYEFNFHLLAPGGDQLSHDSIVQFLHSPQAADSMREMLIAFETEGIEIAVAYNNVRPWGRFFGYWGFIEGYHNGEPNLLWEEAVRNNADVTLEFEGAESITLADAVTMEIVGSPPMIVEFPVESTLTRSGATTVLLEASVPLRAELTAQPAASRSGALTVAMDMVGDAQHELVLAWAGNRSISGPIEFDVVPPAGQIVELSVEPATSEGCASLVSMERAADFEFSVEPATSSRGASAVQVAAVAPDDPTPNAVQVWRARLIGPVAKLPGRIIRRGALLGEDPFGNDIMVYPLIAGRNFGGIALEYASASQILVERSRVGVFLFDLESQDAVAGTIIEVVALDDQRLVSRQAAEATGVKFTTIGKGQVQPSGMVLVEYRHHLLTGTDTAASDPV